MVKLLTDTFDESRKFDDLEIQEEVNDLLTLNQIKDDDIISITYKTSKKSDWYYCKVKIWYKG